jgi:hypothetical protein
MKINQAQIRVIKSVLQSKAQEAREKQVALYEANSKSNSDRAKAAATAVFKKHREKLAASVVLNENGWGSGFCPSISREALAAFDKDCEVAVKAVVTKGTKETVNIDVAALGISSDGSWRQCRRDGLEVPANEKDKWQELADSINESFMTGDAAKLMWIINNFK